MSWAHRLRDGGSLPPPTRFRDTGIVIVGGGISALSAAWQLDRRGFGDYLVLELESAAGGNSAWGANAVSAYPWGAHYVPVPGPRLTHVRELFEELGVIRGYDAAGRPRYEETFLCAAPQERLFLHGQWQEGLVPQIGVTEADRRELEAFFRDTEAWKKWTGRDGKPAFAIPVDESSRDPRATALDGLTMEAYLAERGWRSPALRWYVDYCCRDDYGTGIGEVSAWAGLHYVASRHRDTETGEEHAVVTWPEGNGWLAARLAAKAGERIVPQSLTVAVTPGKHGVEVDSIDTATGECVRTRARAAVVCVPRFVATRVVHGLGREAAAGFTYAPWAVVNLTVREIPSARGAAVAWDNVIYGQQALGYVVATHQNIARFRSPRSVLTYYLPLTHAAPADARREALGRAPEEWTARAIADLSVAHPELEGVVERSDVRVWGHGMIRPVPGFVTGRARHEAARPLGRCFFAHSDLSGISIFEEAQYRGVRAAAAALEKVTGRRVG